MTRNLTGRAAAAAASMGQRAAAAGVGLCSVCRHPVRLHGDIGCAAGECFCSSTGAELRSGVVVEASPVVPPSAAELALLDVVCTCGHRRTEHVVTGSHVQCKTCRSCREFTAPAVGPLPAKWSQPAATHPIREAWTAEEAPDAPAAPPAESTPSPVAAAPAPAAPPAAASEPVREQPAPRPVTVDLPPWLPGAGVPHVKRKPAPVVEVTTPDESVGRQVDAIVAAGKVAARKRPRRSDARPAAPSALGPAAAVGEHDAAKEVTAGSGATGPAVTDPPLDQFRACPAGCGWTQEPTEFDDEVGLRASRAQHLRSHEPWAPVASGGFVRWEPVPSTAQVSPGPVNFEPLLAASLYVSSRWYCPKCHHWPLDPGACPGCRKPLQPVYNVTIPRSVV